MNTINGNFIEKSIPNIKNATIALNIGGVDATMTVEKFAAATASPGLPYKIYTAKIEMSSGAATVFENTLETTISWSVGPGLVSTGVVFSLIGQNNVYVQATSAVANSTPKIVSGNYTPSPWVVTINQTDNAGTSDSTQFVYVEIRVYN